MKYSITACIFTVLISFSYASGLEYTSGIWKNPIYKDYVQPEKKIAASKKALSVITCDSQTALNAHLRENMTARNNTFSLQLQWAFTWEDLGGILDSAFAAAIADDYIRFNLDTFKSDANGYDGDATVIFTIEYLTTYSQEQEVSGRVTQVLAGIISGNMTDEAILKAIHDWIVLNVQYDQSLTRYTAWYALFEGTTVCQGYSLLAYKMLLESGIPVRIVEGEANGGNDQWGSHAWNIVYLCGNWHHVDVTWDDPITSPSKPDYIRWSYYNRTDDQMKIDHVWEFTDYPTASLSYVEGSCCSLPGNVDGRGTADLKDAVLAIQIVAGAAPSTAICKECDVNGDQKIGIPEAIRVMREIAAR